MEHSYLFIFLALLAEIFGIVGGFGSSLFIVPVAAFFLYFYSVLGITAIFHLSSNISKIFLSRSIIYFTNGYVHQHDLYLVSILLVVSIAGTYVGKRILNFVSEELFKKLV